MANDDGIYREVDQDVEEEKQLRQLKQLAPWAIGAMVLIVIVIGGRQYLESQRITKAQESATSFAVAELAAEQDASAAGSWNELRQSAPPGYAAMAAFREAAALARDGENARAVAVFETVIEDDSLPERLRNFARLRAAYLALDTDGEAALRQLSGLQEANTILGAYAREVAGLAAMQAGDYETAASHFERIELIPGAPAPLVQRAGDYAGLARLGADGVSLEGESMGQSLERLLDMAPAAEAPAGDAPEQAPEQAAEETPEQAMEEAAVSDQNDTEEGGTSGD